MIIVLTDKGVVMDIFTVSLFGHREIDDLWKLRDTLFPIIKELLHTKEYVSFFIGRNGEFDEFAASLIKRAQKEIGEETSDITLVLPYSVSGLEYYEKYYDDIIITEGSHPKSAITKKNRWMIEKSDLVIVYVKHKGGAHTAMKYAEKSEKKVINLCKIMAE